MCFSATASFIVGAATSGIGVKTLTKVKKRREYPLASIPILFGVQQFVEGGIWLSLTHQTLNLVFTYIYIFFSHIWWPFFVPFSIFLIEGNKIRRRILLIITLIGIGVSLSFMTFTLFGPLNTQVVSNSIVYTCNYYNLGTVVWFYMLSTTICCFISSHEVIRLFGGAVLIAALITYYFYIHAFTSVWCFFAAIVSIILYFHFKKSSK